MASEMRNRTEFSRAGIRPDSRCVAAADMLTALATQLAERDAELARVTAERDAAQERASRLQNEAITIQDVLNAAVDEVAGAQLDDLETEITDATARIAVLTEALQRQNTAAEGLLAAQARKAPVGFYLSELGVEVLNARAALTTDKEPT